MIHAAALGRPEAARRTRLSRHEARVGLALLLSAAAGMILLVMSQDLITMFLSVEILSTALQALPVEEAARVDGASEWAIFTKIIMPLSPPALAVTAIFAFQRYWNSFLWPLIVMQDPDKFTLQVGLSYIHTSEFGTNYGLLMAAGVLAAIAFAIFRS